MIKAIIFDLDGLMVESEVISYRCYRDFLSTYGVSFTEEDYTSQFPGKAVKLALQMFNDMYHIDCNIEDGVQTILKLEEKVMNTEEVALKEGLVELLILLKQHGYKTIVASSSLRERAMRMIASHNIQGYFDDFIFGCEVKRGKPFPDIFLKACEKLDVLPMEAIVLEDSETGIQAAYDAKIPVICIPDLKYPNEESQKKVTAIFKSLYDVIDYLHLQ